MSAAHLTRFDTQTITLGKIGQFGHRIVRNGAIGTIDRQGTAKAKLGGNPSTNWHYPQGVFTTHPAKDIFIEIQLSRLGKTLAHLGKSLLSSRFRRRNFSCLRPNLAQAGTTRDRQGISGEITNCFGRCGG